MTWLITAQHPPEIFINRNIITELMTLLALHCSNICILLLTNLQQNFVPFKNERDTLQREVICIDSDKR